MSLSTGISSLSTAVGAKIKEIITTLSGKQATLVSGTNIKTINGTTVLGSGDLTITSSYSLPTASTTVLGGVKVGTNLSIDGNGVLSANDTSVGWSEITSKPTTLSGYGITDAAASSHTHNSFIQDDSRNTTTTPETISAGLKIDFKSNGSNGLSDGGGYFGLLTYRQYGSGTDWTGGKSHQLGFTDNENIWQRSGSGTAWGAWKKIVDSANYNSYAPTLTGTGASGTWGINVTGNAATATTASACSSTTDGGISTTQNGNAATWYGRILSKNATNDRAAFLGTYGSIAGVFSHNNALNAWADLYVNSVDGSSGGNVRLPGTTYVSGNQVLHSGNVGSYAAAQKATASVYGGAKMSLSGSTLTITTT